MKFFSLITAVISLSPTVLGAPLLEERQNGQTTPVGAIGNSLNILQSTANQNEAAIGTAVANAQGNAGAAASVAASVNANLQAIANGFIAAGISIVNALNKAGEGVGGQVQALTQAELDSLAFDLNTLAQVIANVSATVSVQITNLTPAAQAAVASEVGVVESAIAPVVNPIMVFADAASKASAKVGATVTGVQSAYAGVEAVIQNFAGTNGLPGISFPGSS